MKKILIIEDDLDIQELIQFFLEDQGYEVITASDGIDGIAVFLKEQIDLILLDILLPKMDGYAVCELIRKESEVPIIMISALGREEDQIKGIAFYFYFTFSNIMYKAKKNFSRNGGIT